MSKSKEVALKDQWSKYAEQTAGTETISGAQFISTRGGVLKFGDDELPGNQMLVIIADAVRENTYYEGKYNAKESNAPKCYAFGREESEMVPGLVLDGNKERDLFAETDPKEEWFEPQHEECTGCPMAEWGSSDTGRGKACQNRRRLALVPAGVCVPEGKRNFVDELFDDPDDILDSDMAYLKVPVTSVKHWAKYVKEIAALGRPWFGVITRIYLEPDGENQFAMRFELVEEVPDHLADAAIKRMEEAKRTIIQPYRPPSEDSAQGVRGLKKTRKGSR